MRSECALAQVTMQAMASVSSSSSSLPPTEGSKQINQVQLPFPVSSIMLRLNDFEQRVEVVTVKTTASVSSSSTSPLPIEGHNQPIQVQVLLFVSSIILHSNISAQHVHASVLTGPGIPSQNTLPMPNRSPVSIRLPRVEPTVPAVDPCARLEHMIPPALVRLV